MKNTKYFIAIFILFVVAAIWAGSNYTPQPKVVPNDGVPQRKELVGFWECLPVKDPTQPHTLECAFGIAVDQSDAHYAVDTQFMSGYPIDFETGTKVRVVGMVTPVEALSSIQKYDIDGIISATEIEKI